MGRATPLPLVTAPAISCMIAITSAEPSAGKTLDRTAHLAPRSPLAHENFVLDMQARVLPAAAIGSRYVTTVTARQCVSYRREIQQTPTLQTPLADV
jgi:hypothetical protein